MPPYNLIPLRSNEPSTQDYLAQKILGYELFREHGCFDEAYINAHLIFIYWLYCKVWVRSKHEPKLLKNIFTLHSFDNNFRMIKFLDADSALLMHKLKLEERKYAEVFGNLCLDADDVKKLKDLIDVRNNILHPTGVIAISDELELDELLEAQDRIGDKIATGTTKSFLRLIKKPYGVPTYHRLKRWDTDLLLEQELFAKYQISQKDLDIMAIYLKPKKAKASV